MKTKCRLSALAFILVATTVPTVGQQDAARPDFSGTWKLNPKKSDLSAKSPLAREIMVVTCNGLTIEMRHASVIDGHEIVQIFIADGQPHTFKESPQVEFETKASWEKSALVVVKVTHLASEPNRHPAVITSRWVLSKDGTTLKSEVHFSGLPRNDVYVFDKQ